MYYLLKASAILGIFYVFYKFVLQRETFFQSNRLFLLVGIISALIIPLIVVPIYIEQTTTALKDFVITESGTTNKIQETFDWVQLILILYISGVLFFSGKFIISLISLSKLLITNRKEKIGDFYFINSEKEIAPFSFFNYIVYNQNSFEQSELQQILTHEKVHAHQWHSFDVLLSQIATIVFWFNPISWLYKKELQQNLEFIADAISQEKTNCEQSYQKLLLKTSIAKNQLAFTNNFYNSLIKKRILMLNKNRSNTKSQWKIALILPLIIAFIFTFNTKVIAQTAKNSKPQVVETEVEVEDKIETAIITQNTSKSDLEKIVRNFAKEGITLKFKSVIRNIDGEITSIKINANSKNSNTNFNTNSTNPIEPIKITFDEDGKNISIGNNSNSANTDGYIYITKKGEKTIVSKGKGNQTFTFTSDDGEEIEVVEIIEETEEVESDNDSPLYYIDGKELTKEEIDKLDTDDIESISVLKGASALEKYGEKGKNGVIEITTKKK